VSNQWALDPATYADVVRAEVPGYDRLQAKVAEATSSIRASRILDLGSGTGVTARNVSAVHDGADLVGIDCSNEMLAEARRLLPEATFMVRRLEEPLPRGPFDLVVSAFAIHHLGESAKADLFVRVGAVLREGGRFVFCDVVVPDGPVPVPVPLEDEVDFPSSVDDQIAWLQAAGLEASVIHAEHDLCILAGDKAETDNG
jgi:trans-aconitate methyltransferase